MAKIVFTWELGDGYGHVTKLSPLANELQKMGHEVSFICKNLLSSERFLGNLGYSIIQAPINIEKTTTNLPLAASYSELLLRQDWLIEDSLRARVKAWQALFYLLKPDLIIFNHSPTALLSTYTSAVKRVQFGTGFECPESSLKDGLVFQPWGYQ